MLFRLGCPPREGMAMNDSDTPKPKRRWYQFRMRTLLVFVLLLSVPLSWFAWKLQKARRQREAVEAIVEAGGYVYYDFQIDETGAEITGAQPTAPVWLRKSLGDDFFRAVTTVDLSDRHWTRVPQRTEQPQRAIPRRQRGHRRGTGAP